MPNPAWAQALEAMRHAHWLTAKRRAGAMPSVPLDADQYDAMLRAARPHMLRAVVEGMTDHDLVRLFRAAGISIFPERQTCRTAILAALTASAERLTDAAGRLP